MDYSKTLTPAEADTLGDNDMKILRHAEQDLHEAIQLTPARAESAFERGLRLKNTLDVVEADPYEDFVRAWPFIVNCEYQFWRIYADVPLQNNPFLTHWVDTLQMLDGEDILHIGLPSNSVADEVDAARVLWIKTLLQQNDLRRWLDYTPMEVYDELANKGLSAPFDIETYVQMLEDEGIYESRAEPQPVNPGPSVQRTEQAHVDSQLLYRPMSRDSSPQDALQKQKDEILSMLNTQPESAIFALTRLPIAIPYLDFLTTLLADSTLQNHNIEPAPIVTLYIQHALRSVERAERPPSPESQPGMGVNGRAEQNGELEYGRDVQTRYIRLLLLFIKSLVRKGLVELEVLFYEIQEITVRYVWIQEVREFKRWTEGGGAE